MTWHGILESPPEMDRGTSDLTVSADREVSVHDYGRGKVVWCPSNIALGARETGDYAPLSDFLYGSLPDRAVSLFFSNRCTRPLVLESLYIFWIWMAVSRLSLTPPMAGTMWFSIMFS